MLNTNALRLEEHFLFYIELKFSVYYLITLKPHFFLFHNVLSYPEKPIQPFDK